ncbi:MAG: sulfatase-like hydrolase/transferase [Planctomycetaceae bacterium]|nr:sulfatase-like hydrolase/transferase [Planctomycetaceae bacterium]
MLRLALLSFVLLTGHLAHGAQSTPNFIVFLTDDLGWGDLGCQGHPEIKTPHLDEFATQGMRFTQCYSACSVCSPSRSSILTGRTPYRNGVWRWIPEGSEYHLRTSEITIATLLKQRGYGTCHAGKWHLNGKFNSPDQPQPDDHGYDHWLATQNNAAPNHLNPTNYVRNREPVGPMQGPSAILAVSEAIEWLKSRPADAPPFFITVWTHEPHLPIESAPEYMAPYQHLDDPDLRQHHGNVTQMDAAFGKLMSAVDEFGFRENTCVFFTSDNGPEGNGLKGRTRGSTGGLRGRKRHTHEGGIRVPGMIRWPGHVEPGSVCETPVIGSDIFSTICDIVDVPLPADRIIDGTSLVPLFAGQGIERAEPLYWRNHLAPSQYKVALRIGDYKIVGSDDLTKFELYNIADDWQETTDLAEQQPERFAALRQQLIDYDASVLADGPDWWKHEAPPKRKVSAELAPGKDETGQFAVVRGGTVTKVDGGIELTGQGECLALEKLAEPIREGTFRVRYQSTVSSGRTRNALFCFAQEPSNAGTIKVGTAIGLGQHVAFQGDWSQLGNLAKVNADFRPTDDFELEVTINCAEHTLTATINGDKLTATLPNNLKQIEYVGYYTKQTSSRFERVE